MINILTIVTKEATAIFDAASALNDCGYIVWDIASGFQIVDDVSATGFVILKHSDFFGLQFTGIAILANLKAHFLSFS